MRTLNRRARRDDERDAAVIKKIKPGIDAGLFLALMYAS